MKTVLIRALKDRRVNILAFSLGGLIFLWLYIALFPSIQSSFSANPEIAKAYPEQFLKAFGIKSLVFENVESFLAIEQFSITWPLLLMFVAISSAGAAIAGEIERGTMAITLALPVSRIKIFLARYLAGLLGILFFIVISTTTTIPLAKLHHLTANTNHIMMTTWLCIMFGLAIHGLGMLFSSIFSERGRVFFSMGALMVVMYFLNIISSLKDNLSDLKYLSFFHYFNTNDSLNNGTIDRWAYWVFLGIAIVGPIIGAWWFAKRDVAV